ncbi:NAD(P)H-dependent oxidoreductase [Salsuginibacillus kocurii]|uniref:NAD(P)H-dependent oxidoreductase n=1 Tax=Salsuginibacillus kocurii TaxID=427078 RepID=UPI000376A9B4|nr:NAD(P)H-dependent oxidoreductase [Salsuginibacillus kocurii]
MDRHLLIFMHPKQDSFNGAILNKVKETLLEADKQVYTRNVTELSLNPSLTIQEYEDTLQGIYKEEIKEEFSYWEWADHITFIFPVWWGSFPALAKGYLDRVIAYGLAYELENEEPIGKLEGKTGHAIFTTGAPVDKFQAEGLTDSINMILQKAIFEFCGMKHELSLQLGYVVEASTQERTKMLNQVKAEVTKKLLSSC